MRTRINHFEKWTRPEKRRLIDAERFLLVAGKSDREKSLKCRMKICTLTRVVRLRALPPLEKEAVLIVGKKYLISRFVTVMQIYIQ